MIILRYNQRGGSVLNRGFVTLAGAIWLRQENNDPVRRHDRNRCPRKVFSLHAISVPDEDKWFSDRTRLSKISKVTANDDGQDLEFHC